MQQGKDTILLVQSTDAALAEKGLLIGNLTENSYSIENDVLDESTKFGRIVGYGQNSESFELTAYGEAGDPGQVAILDAIKNKKQLKVWEVDINLNANGKHDAVFGYTIVESVEKSAAQDGFVEISATVQVIGQTQDGEVDALPPDMIDFAKYGFEAPGATTGEFPDQTPQPPSAPTNLAAGTATSSAIPLSWTAVAGTGVTYRVYKDGVQEGGDLSATTYTVSGLTSGTSYDFEVTAVESGVESAKSNKVTKSTL